MADLKPLVEREMDRAGEPALAFEDLEGLRVRRRRTKQVTAAVVGLGLVLILSLVGASIYRSAPANRPPDQPPPNPPQQPPRRPPPRGPPPWPSGSRSRSPAGSSTTRTPASGPWTRARRPPRRWCPSASRERPTPTAGSHRSRCPSAGRAQAPRSF